MTAPTKPFPTYSWRWLSVQPSEGLLKTPVFLGVLRALQHHEGKPYSSTQLYQELLRVQDETSTNIKLARKPERNLLRNSGQYWRGTGLLVSKYGEVELTPLGHKVASGDITNDEFVALMVRNTILPNPQTYSKVDLSKWRNAGLRLKPFEIILSVMDAIGRITSPDQAYLTPNELIHIVIPLAGAKTPLDKMTKNITACRTGRLDVSNYPNCAPGANDKRLAREFLLFLNNFGICQTDGNTNRYEQRFMLDQLFSTAMMPDLHVSLLEDPSCEDEEIRTSRDSEIPVIIERQRISTTAIRRVNQSRFRREVLLASDNRCILTKEITTDVIEAAHIIPVDHGGDDAINNGLCMRVDIHRLFDNGKIRIKSSGEVLFNSGIGKAISYGSLPRRISFPTGVSTRNVEWRYRYL